MFSGIIEQVGTVVHNTPQSRAERSIVRLEIDCGGLIDELKSGASVAINGVCLTLVTLRGPVGGFDVIPETLRATNLGSLEPGDCVNLERSVAAGQRIDGHFVQGHVDGVGTIERIVRDDDEFVLHVRVGAALTPFVIRKGSIALDGTSLTIVDVRDDCFSVALIPTTLERTVLGRRSVGDSVNVETDMLARILVARLDALDLDAVRSSELPA